MTVPEEHPELTETEEHKKTLTSPASNEEYLAFLHSLEPLPDVEAKLKTTIDFMESTLAQSGSPHFKSFWEARKLSLEFFKENITPALRAELWNRYSVLSKEARRLKELLDEQSAFAVEQIEIAIAALEHDLTHIEEHLDKIPAVEFPSECRTLRDRFPFYQNLQRRLNLLNTLASRINVLRKELIKTEMRVRQKNRFFQRLSEAGDKVFPQRKELIKEISEQFTKDVDHFVSAHFAQDSLHESMFGLREEIKALQSIAKQLTLNTHAFSQTRLRLSECWDKLKHLEKERKKERAQQKVLFRQNAEQIVQQVEALHKEFQEGGLTTQNAVARIDELMSHMRKTDLGKDELKFLRDEIGKVRVLVLEKLKQEESNRLQQDLEKERVRKEAYQTLKKQIDELLHTPETTAVESLQADREKILSEISSSNFSKMEKQELERLLKPLRDIITERKEKALLSLSDDDRHSLQQLKDIYQQRKDRRQEIKNQLETLRKSSGSSGLGFEQAMQVNAQINAEKERLDKANQGIKEIESKISELQKKVE